MVDALAENRFLSNDFQQAFSPKTNIFLVLEIFLNYFSKSTSILQENVL